MISSKIWRAFTDTAYCLTILPYILNHKYRTHKYGDTVAEKFGIVPTRKTGRECLQIHAVSVGEVIAASPIIEEFSSKYPDWDIHITVSTATGKEVAEKRYPNIPVSFFPLDLSIWVKRFLRNIRPSAVVLMELEIWPNFLSLCNDYSIPVIVANGRITQKSSESYIKYSWFPILKQMLRIPSLWLAQTEEYADRFHSIGVSKDRILTLGSVKYDTIPTEPDTDARAKYRSILGAVEDSRVIIAGSTHSPEESILLKAYSELSTRHQNIKLVIVPRHPHRFTEVYEEGCQFGSCSRYTELEDNAAGDSADIIIVDRMGILSELYNAADLVFIGGSFIDHGGQNMLETCGIGKATVIGNSYYNFTDAMEILKDAGGIEIVSQPDDLPRIFDKLLTDDAYTRRLGSAGREAMLSRKGCSRKTVEILSKYL